MATFSAQRQRGQQIEELENESDLVAAQARQFVIGEPAQAASVDFDLARRRGVQPADQIQQRRFARARRPDDGHHLAARDGQIHVLQRRDRAFAFKNLADVREADQLSRAPYCYHDRKSMRIGIDAGGTFTDFIVVRDDGAIETFKLRSNPRSPASVILAGLEQAAAGRRAEVIHGSTVATNALLERKGRANRAGNHGRF